MARVDIHSCLINSKSENELSIEISIHPDQLAWIFFLFTKFNFMESNTNGTQGEILRGKIDSLSKLGIADLADRLNKMTDGLTVPNYDYECMLRMESEIARIREALKYCVENGENSRGSLMAMARYFYEGEMQTYATRPQMVDYLKRNGLLPNEGCLAVDFATGPGEALKLLSDARPQYRTTGVDISPQFVARNPKVKFGLADAPKSRPDLLPVKSNSAGFAMSALALDRVSDQFSYIDNLSRVLRPNGQFAMGTLLPVIAEDDGPDVKNRIVYAPKEKRIADTGTILGDIKLVAEYISDTLRASTLAKKVPYGAKSSDGDQNYDSFFVFTGKKGK